VSGVPAVVWVLAGREVRRFARQPSRVVGTLATPLVFWLLLGGGFAGVTTAGGVAYGAYFFPGTLALMVLFAAIFGAISLIDDRTQGFLQGVLVAPVPRVAVVAGKVVGGAVLATLQAWVLLPLAPLAGVGLDAGALVRTAAALAGLALVLSAFGFACAWRFASIQGFHAVMNLVLMPMWLLSGAVFPAASSAAWLRALAMVNPLGYGVALLRHALGPAAGSGDPALPGVTISLLVLVGWGVASLLVAARLAGGREEG
jgi:ABC-2 type transport system permease protein